MYVYCGDQTHLFWQYLFVCISTEEVLLLNFRCVLESCILLSFLFGLFSGSGGLGSTSLTVGLDDLNGLFPI